jgi:TolA-binding protein
MTFKSLFAVLLLASCFTFAQTTPPPSGQSQTAPPAGSGPNAQRRAERRQRMQQMRQQHMQMMKDQIDKMTAKLNDMKSAAANITDENGKKMAQDNIDMWQMLLDHMNQMMQHMEQGPGMGGPGGPGMAMMNDMPGGMACCQKSAKGEMADCCKSGKCGKDASGKMSCGGGQTTGDSMSTMDQSK